MRHLWVSTSYIRGPRARTQFLNATNLPLGSAQKKKKALCLKRSAKILPKRRPTYLRSSCGRLIGQCTVLSQCLFLTKTRHLVQSQILPTESKINHDPKEKCPVIEVPKFKRFLNRYSQSQHNSQLHEECHLMVTVGKSTRYANKVTRRNNVKKN